VSFLTDYGLSDGFVAACHGVLLARGVTALDITHLIGPGDIRRGAAVLAQTVPYLPVTVHLAVVDPGVGTGRHGLVLTTPRGLLVGPDNGLLLPAAAVLGGVSAAVSLLARPGVPATFHGRDVFAPAVAALATGTPPTALGPAVEPADLVRLPPALVRFSPDADADGTADADADTAAADAIGSVGSDASGPAGDPAGSGGVAEFGAGPREAGGVVGGAAGGGRADGAVRADPGVAGVLVAEVVLVDRFGNVQLAAAGEVLGRAGLRPGRLAAVRIGPAFPDPPVTVPVGVTFGSVPSGDPVLYVDSAGMAAFAVRDGHAASWLGLAAGDVVAIRAV
jgi:S-adenosylmethionine hydrolase